MSSLDTLYFGCKGEVGHFTYDSNMRLIRLRGPEGNDLRWIGCLDGLLAPRNTFQQYVAAFHKRDNSSSTFFIKGRWLFHETLARAESVFPKIFQRFQFEIKQEGSK